MTGVPSLPVNNNQFTCLEVEEVSDEGQATDEQDTPKIPKIPKCPKPPKWENKLPRSYKIAVASPGSKSLKIPVQVQTTDTGEIHGVEGLVDCGADGEFLDSEFIKRNKIPTRQLVRPIPVNNVDGSPNENGPIREVADLVLRYKGHTERIVFAVTQLGKEDMILGLPWLKEHNPEIDWNTEEVRMTRCPTQCKQCLQELREEKRKQAEEVHRIRRCRAGPFPRATVEDEEEEDGEEEEEEEEDEGREVPEKGDRIFATAIHLEGYNVCATRNFSQ